MRVTFGLFKTLIILPELVQFVIVILFEMTKVLPPTADNKPLILPETFVIVELSRSRRFDCIIKSKKPIGVVAKTEF